MDKTALVPNPLRDASGVSVPVVVGLVLSLAGLPLANAALSEFVSLSGIRQVLAGLSLSWAVALAVLALVALWERRPLDSIGLERPTVRDVGWGLVAFVLGLLAFAATAPLVRALGLSTTQSGIEAASEMPVAVLVAMAVTAGVTEEILFRGYSIERLAELTGDVRVGAVVAYVAFVAIHAPVWGLGATIQIGGFSVVVTALYVWRRSLSACIVMHTANDLFAFVLVPMLFAE